MRLKLTGPKAHDWPEPIFEHDKSFGLILLRLAFGFEFGGSWLGYTKGEDLPRNPFVWIYLGLWWLELYFDRDGTWN